MCGLLQYSLYGTRDAAQNWEEELASTLSDVKLTRGSACPCVWKGCTKDENIVATVHGDEITIGGERSTVECLIKMKSRKYEIKKQVIGEDPDLENSGEILNCVIEWSRDGITIDADQRDVRETLDDLEMEPAITLRLHAPWRWRVRAAQEGMKARRRTDADKDKLRSSTNGAT